MREIKFREWDDGIMVYSHNNSIYHTNTQKSWFFNVIRSDAIIMQYTGLKDKNGKEIYEGDIVEMSDPYGETKAVCEIRFVNGGFIVEANGWFNAGEADITTIGWAIEQEIKVEVIGNIYENKELLENDKNN